MKERVGKLASRACPHSLPQCPTTLARGFLTTQACVPFSRSPARGHMEALLNDGEPLVSVSRFPRSPARGHMEALLNDGEPLVPGKAPLSVFSSRKDLTI
jgi:hypothetical protein